MESQLEKALLTLYKEEMVAFLKGHPELFEEAINLALSSKNRLSWRSAGLIWACMEENDPRVTKHINRIINSLDSKSEGHQRELLKILYLMELNEEQEGLIYSKCINIWKKISLQPSIRFNAFKFIVKIAQKYPELSQEVILLTQMHYLEGLSSGAKKSILKMIIKIDLFS
jgi:hypothetical protein